MIDIEKNVQIINAGQHPAFVVIPHTNWVRIRAMLEDAADGRAYDRAKAAWQHDGKKAYPAAIAKRIARGEHPISVLREWRGLSQRQLAEKTGLNAQSISHIETGVRKGGLAALRKIAKALNISLELLTDDI